MISMAPDLDDTLANWGYDPGHTSRINAINQVKDAIYSEDNTKDSWLTVWYELYRSNSKEYVENMIKLGYDGLIVTPMHSDGKRKHVVIYNIDSMSIIEYEQFKETKEESYKENIMSKTLSESANRYMYEDEDTNQHQSDVDYLTGLFGKNLGLNSDWASDAWHVGGNLWIVYDEGTQEWAAVNRDIKDEDSKSEDLFVSDDVNAVIDFVKNKVEGSANKDMDEGVNISVSRIENSRGYWDMEVDGEEYSGYVEFYDDERRGPDVEWDDAPDNFEDFESQIIDVVSTEFYK